MRLTLKSKFRFAVFALMRFTSALAVAQMHTLPPSLPCELRIVSLEAAYLVVEWSPATADTSHPHAISQSQAKYLTAKHNISVRVLRSMPTSSSLQLQVRTDTGRVVEAVSLDLEYGYYRRKQDART